MELKTCPNCGREVLSLITDAANGKRYCYQCIPNPESCPGAVFVSRKMDELHAASKLETYSVEQRLKDLKDPPRCECGEVLDVLEGQLCSKCEGEAFRLAHRQRRAPIEQRQPDDRPDYFAPAPSAEDVVLRRIKGNYRCQMISKSIRDEGLASIPELWSAHDIPESFKEVLTSTAGPRARGGEDLPDLAEGEVEIARLSLVDSVHGEVTSLRAKRDPKDGTILLSMVDEYEMEFKLPTSKLSIPLTAEEVLALFRDTDPTPLATTCQVEFSSFFYRNLDAMFSRTSKSERYDDPKARRTQSSDQGASPVEVVDETLRETSEVLNHQDAVGIVTCAGPFVQFITKNDSGLPAKVAHGVVNGIAILGTIFVKRSAGRVSGRYQPFQKYAHDESANKILQMALDKILASPDGGKNSELLNLSETQAAVKFSREADASDGDTHSREGVSGPGDFSGFDATRLGEELRDLSARLKNDSAERGAVLDKPYHLFFFAAVDRDGVPRFFDIMRQKNGFTLAETATSAPRLGQCVETVYDNAAGETHHVHRNYGNFRTRTARQAMEEFAKPAGLTNVTEIAETRTLREAEPSWKFIYEKLGCPPIAFTPKFMSDYPTAGGHSTSNAVENRRILVVHHEQLIAEFICNLLRQDGYETRTECSSVNAIRASVEFAPRLLIIDPMMPDILGLDVAKQIFDQTQCKVLLVSAGASNSDFGEVVGDLRSKGCDCAALGLPFEKEKLLELVRTRIRSEAVVPGDMGPSPRQAQNVFPKAHSPESMIDFATMTPVMPDAELRKGFIRVIMPNGKCFDILEELWTKAREIEPGCVIMSLKATGKKQN